MLKCREIKSYKEVFDPVRKIWVKLTPEEQVRQSYIMWLNIVKKVPFSHISVEKEIIINNLSRRYDIVIYGDNCIPVAVIECKATNIAITQSTVEQVGIYNKALKVPIIGITNGTSSCYFYINFETGEIISHTDLILSF